MSDHCSDFGILGCMCNECYTKEFMGKETPKHKFAVGDIQKKHHDRVVAGAPITETDYQEGYRKGYEAGSRDAESRIRYASHDMGR